MGCRVPWAGGATPVSCIRCERSRVLSTSSVGEGPSLHSRHLLRVLTMRFVFHSVR